MRLVNTWSRSACRFLQWCELTAYLVRARDVDLHDQVPVLIFHVLEADVAEDTGVVDEHIDAAKVVNGSLDDALAVDDIVVVGDSLAAGLLDGLDDSICGL